MADEEMTMGELMPIVKAAAPDPVRVGRYLVTWVGEIPAEDWSEDADETAFWASQPGIHESIAEAEADFAAGRTYSEEEVRAMLDARLRAEETGEPDE